MYSEPTKGNKVQTPKYENVDEKDGDSQYICNTCYWLVCYLKDPRLGLISYKLGASTWFIIGS